MNTRFATFTRATLAAVFAAALVAGPADAKVGGGASSGSRGGRTFSAPPSTATAPSAAQPMQRTETPSFGAQRPGFSPAPSAGPRFGFGTGMMAGLLGAGVLGMMLGHGFTGGLFGLTSFLGFLFQIALVGGLIWLAVRLLRRRFEPTLAGAGAGAGAPYARSPLGAGPVPGTGGGSSGPRVRDEVGIVASDYASFERALSEIQTAYGREDLQRLSTLATPEMVRYFAGDLEANRRNNVHNEIGEAKLLQGDLAEAWREGQTEYATVAMRFSLVDATVDRASGRVISGDRTRPEEVREIWTFRRDGRGPWVLSAIQQTA